LTDLDFQRGAGERLWEDDDVEHVRGWGLVWGGFGAVPEALGGGGVGGGGVGGGGEKVLERLRVKGWRDVYDDEEAVLPLAPVARDISNQTNILIPLTIRMIRFPNLTAKQNLGYVAWVLL